MALHIQDLVYRSSMDDIESFWSHQADKLSWHKRSEKILQRTAETLEDGTTHGHWTWFPGGEISTTYNCIDRHVLNGNGHALPSAGTGLKEQYTYEQLMEEVETLAGVLQEKDVKNGGIVLIYSESSII
jgi:propionyl-CoA synthetase